MKVKTNRFLNEALTDKLVEMIKSSIVCYATIKEIEFTTTGFANVIVGVNGESYEISYEYNINKVEYLTTRIIK